MEGTKSKFTLIAVGIILLFACSIFTRYPEAWFEADGQSACVITTELQESDFTGTWKNTGFVYSETLTFRNDGKYKQIYNFESYEFETEWNTWRIEKTDEGLVYLHLENMHYCNSTDELCFEPDGGGGESLYRDWCRDRTFEMGDDVILSVINADGFRNPEFKNAPSGIALMHMFRGGSIATVHFIQIGE